MNISPNSRNILTVFSKLLGIDGLKWDSEGMIELKLDESDGRGEPIYVSIACQDNSDVLILCSQILAKTKSLPDSLLRRILATNTKLGGMDGAPSLAIVSDSGALVLQQSINLGNLDYPDFEAAWLGYVDAHDKISDKLKRLVPDRDDDSDFGANGSGAGTGAGTANFSLDDLRSGMFRV